MTVTPSKAPPADPFKSIVPLAPPPAWVVQLVGGPVRRVVARVVASTVRLYVERPDGTTAILDLARRGGPTLACSWVEPGPAGAVRRPVPAVVAMTIDERLTLYRHLGRVRWASAQALGDARGYRYPASPTEQRLAEVCRALGQVRTPDAGAELAPAFAALADAPGDPVFAGLRLYLDLLSGRWGEVFRAADAGVAVPDWLAPAVLGAAGDQDGLQALTRRGGVGAGQGALALTAAVALKQLGFVDAAFSCYREGMDALMGLERADVCLEVSDLHRLRGERAEAVAWARQALLCRPDHDALLHRVSDRLIRCGALDDAWAALSERCAREPLDRGAALRLARLLLWAGRAAEARPLLARAGALGSDDPEALAVEGALLAVEGRWDEAARAFDRVRRLDPRDREAVTWLAEIAFRRGDLDAARRQLDAARAVAQNGIHVVLTTATNPARNRVSKDRHLGPLLQLLGESTEPWLVHEEDPREVALALLDTFGGNRGEPLTRLDPAGPREGSLGLVVVPPPPADRALVSRDAASDIIKRLGTAPVEALEADFERLASEFPESPHPHCYWGELNLWLGRYDRAVQLFDAGEARCRARWSFVGRAAVHVLRGEFERADAELAECANYFPPVVGATTHVYQGEMARRRGDLAGALAHLSEAVRCKPGRVAAWMNLALTHLALGRRDEAERIFSRLEARVPRLYWDAHRALTGEPCWPVPASHLEALFEKALEMMRGNRSSHTISYFDPEGRLRIAHDGEAWRRQLARNACFVATGLRHRLARGLEEA